VDLPSRSQKPEILIEPDWLEANLDNPKVRIVDCNVVMHTQPVGPSVIESKREDWAAAHIPGAAYLHMTEDLSAPRGNLIYNLPSADHMTEKLQSIGVDADTTIVLYGPARAGSVPRAWWVIRATGAKDVRILNGGWERWQAEGRPVSSDMPVFARGNFVAQTEQARVAGKEDVLEVLGDPDVLLINALNEAQHKGEYFRYGRPGRIPGSVNVPSADMHLPDGRYKPMAELEALFADVDADSATRIITYCGGGIAASNTCFALEMLGYDNVAMYDQSLNEWGNDESLPLEVG
jgi:thiosulfate/3-mercaptopyruvate sulfurtransferase